ncbi:MAG: helix-turn-helix domain-containing protein, partial [Candidatus Dormibacteraceae bacterium]
QLFTALPLVEQAKAELRAAGSRPRRTALSGISSLTPGERRIIELAARGNSNPEIAQALFVTLKTVKWHLGNAFQKLQITSRQQLSAILETDDVYLQASR